MANYKCVKCEATGHSKCQISRSFFPEDQYEAALSHSLKREIKREKVTYVDGTEGDKCTVTIVSIFYPFSSMNEEDVLVETIRKIRMVPEEVMKHWICDHRYALQDDRCDLGCCKRKNGHLDG